MLAALEVVQTKGRIEKVKVSDDFTLMIDYAHNAMSLESLLTTLKEYNPKRLVCLFGCGGNRSKLRRYEMGEVSGNLADLTVITSDNPRFEEPQAIIDDIKTGIAKTSGKYVEIIDRKEAIRYVIENGAGPATSSSWPGRATRTIRKSAESSIPWMSGCLSRRFWRS